MKKPEILKQLIEKSGLTQKAFAEKHGIDEPKLSRWVTGKIEPMHATVQLIAFEEGYYLEWIFELKPI